MSNERIVKLKDAPAPDLLIEYPNGFLCALMFHFAPEGHDLRAIAEDNGFELHSVELSWEDEPEIHGRYFEQGEAEDAIRGWDPAAPVGWHLAGKWDTDDGPTAFFIRKSVSTQEPAK